MSVGTRTSAWSFRTAVLASCVVLGTSFAGMPTAAPARDLPLVEAARAADAGAVRAPLERSGDVNTAQADGTTALHWVAYKGHVETARLLLGAGADGEAANRYGVTLLALVAGRGSAAIVEALLGGGADPNTTLPAGETVLMSAARTGNVYVLRLLLTRGADLRARVGWRGRTALHRAAAENHPAALDTLIELGADVDQRAAAGWCALLYAARAGKADAVSAFLRKGRRRERHHPADRLRRRRFGRRPSRPAGRHQPLVLAVMNERSRWRSISSSAAPIRTRPNRAGRRCTSWRTRGARIPARACRPWCCSTASTRGPSRASCSTTARTRTGARPSGSTTASGTT